MMGRDALLDRFQAKRDALHHDAQRHREVRDTYNERTRRHAMQRDEHNAQVRALVERANAHRSKRDELNAKVRAAKAERDRLNHDAQEKLSRLQELRKARGGPAAGAVPLAKLKAELRHLEYQQQTQVMSPQKEKALIDLIATKLKEIKTRESAVEEDDELRQATDAMKEAKARAEERHAELTRFAVEAQEEHDKMAALFAEADGVRKLADAAQGEFVKSKIESDRLHRLHIDAVLAMKDLDRVMDALRERTTGMAGGPSRATSAQQEAESIFDRFRKGEKLSIDDLMALQKAGRL